MSRNRRSIGIHAITPNHIIVRAHCNVPLHAPTQRRIYPHIIKLKNSAVPHQIKKQIINQIFG